LFFIKLIVFLRVLNVSNLLELPGLILHRLSVQVVNLMLEHPADEAIAEHVTLTALKVPKLDLDLLRSLNQGYVVVI
jgi:hypothetical protein